MLFFDTTNLIGWAANIASTLFVLGGVFSFIRLVKGPSFPDRVVVIDFLAVLVVSFASMFSIVTGFSAYLDVAVAFALVAFLGTVAFARFAERRTPGRSPDDILTQQNRKTRAEDGR